MISTMTMFIGDDDLKHRKNCESCPTQVTWKVKFKCQISLSCLSSVTVVSVPYPGYPVCPDDHDDHDYHDDDDYVDHLQGGFFNWSALKMIKCQITCKSLQIPSARIS